jgi:NTP pyrophosphatase (non-canonical NTP hydrolase)
MTEAQSRELAPEQLETVGAEIADVLLYLIQLADALGIDPSWQRGPSCRSMN